MVQDAKEWKLVDVQQGKVVFSASYHHNLLRIDPSTLTPTANTLAVKVKDTLNIIHRRFAHRIRLSRMSVCAECIDAKATRALIPKGVGRVDVIGGLIDSDLSRKMPVHS